jgi:hypothetical protein
VVWLLVAEVIQSGIAHSEKLGQSFLFGLFAEGLEFCQDFDPAVCAKPSQMFAETLC